MELEILAGTVEFDGAGPVGGAFRTGGDRLTDRTRKTGYTTAHPAGGSRPGWSAPQALHVRADSSE